MAKTSSHIDTGGISSPQAPTRILVVDDFEPFRSFVLSVFSEASEFEIICEVSDGLEAVQKAEELLPDLILLDIGLPRLNGIEAARQIRKLAPNSKILFLSQESSADVVREALSFGAMGYVVKADAGNELLPAVEAVRQGRQFVSSGSLGNFTEAADSEAPDCTGRKPTAPSVAPGRSKIPGSREAQF
jgi:DNA-binding NarL/FixJ family response regulator